MKKAMDERRTLEQIGGQDKRAGLRKVIDEFDLWIESLN